MQLAEFKKKVFEAVQFANDRGIQIVPGKYGVHFKKEYGAWILSDTSRTCCPISAIALMEQPPQTQQGCSLFVSSTAASIGQKLDIDLGKVCAFIQGFDGRKSTLMASRTYRRWHRFGKELRNQLTST